MACGTVEIRRQEGGVNDVMVVRPANAPARVIDKGRGLDQGTYVVAIPSSGASSSGSGCSIFGAAGSGSAGLLSVTTTMDSGTPYAVQTYSVVE